MKIRLLLGTRNEGKIAEARSILGGLDNLELLTKDTISFPEVEEDADSYQGNSEKKARVIAESVGLAVLAEDAGLEVSALGGEPGVYSSRYAGPTATDEENNRKLLSRLEGSEDRSAKFVSVVTLLLPDGGVVSAEGILRGRIAESPRGSSGFGYDPLFIPTGFDKTLAQLGPQVKNKISHRRKSLLKLRPKLREVLEGG